MQRALRAVVLLALLLLTAIVYRQNIVGGVPFIAPNPSKSMAFAARSLARGTGLSAPEYYDMYESLRAHSAKHPRVTVYQEYFSLGADGHTLYPKHSLLAVSANAFFYLIFGEFGFVLFTGVCYLACLYLLYRLSLRWMSGTTALLLLLAIVISTPLASFVWGFSYDLFAAVLVLAAVVYAPRYPVLAGFALGCSLWLRLTQLLFVPLLYPWGRDHAEGRKSVIPAVIGMALAVVPLLAINYVLWEEPIRGGYSRLLWFADGQAVLDSRSHSLAEAFSLAILVNEWRLKLFGVPEGVGAYGLNPGLFEVYPLAYTFPLLLPLAWTRPRQAALRALILVSLGNILFMMSYGRWIDASGHRFVLAAVLLLMVSAAAALVHFLQRWFKAGCLAAPGTRPSNEEAV